MRHRAPRRAAGAQRGRARARHLVQACCDDGHRSLDFWGRNLVDHLIGLLPRLLRTAELLEANGLTARVVDYAFFPFNELFEANREQMERVEALSDAHHFASGDEEVAVAYVLGIERAPQGT